MYQQMKRNEVGINDPFIFFWKGFQSKDAYQRQNVLERFLRQLDHIHVESVYRASGFVSNSWK